MNDAGGKVAVVPLPPQGVPLHPKSGNLNGQSQFQRDCTKRLTCLHDMIESYTHNNKAVRMKQQEFVSLLKHGAVQSVNIRTDDLLHGQWVIFAWVPEGSQDVKNGIELARSKVRALAASLDTAHAWIRSLGWADTITIDG